MSLQPEVINFLLSLPSYERELFLHIYSFNNQLISINHNIIRNKTDHLYRSVITDFINRFHIESSTPIYNNQSIIDDRAEPPSTDMKKSNISDSIGSSEKINFSKLHHITQTPDNSNIDEFAFIGKWGSPIGSADLDDDDNNIILNNQTIDTNQPKNNNEILLLINRDKNNSDLSSDD